MPDLALPPIRTDLADARRDLDEAGLARFAGAAAPEEVTAVRERLIAQAAAEDAQGTAFRDSGPVVRNEAGAANQRVWNLINKGEAFRRIVMNDVAQTLVRHLLGEDLLLFSCTANIACKGGESQFLHGDQVFAPEQTPYPLVANCLWMLDDFSNENGATRVVPGSQHAGRWPSVGEVVETLPATGPRGAIMVWDGRLWHGTGVNRTAAPRRGLLAAYCRPFVRQQENATMSVSPEVLQACSPELKALLGFRSWMGLGTVDGADHGVLRDRPARFSREL